MIREAVWTALLFASCAVGVAAAGAVVAHAWLAIAARRASLLALLLVVAGCATVPRGPAPDFVDVVHTHAFTLDVSLLGGPVRATIEAPSAEHCRRLHRAVWSALRDSNAELSACARTEDAPR